MSDIAFQRSLTAVTILVILWIIAGIVLYVWPIILVVLSGLVMELVVAIVFLHYWGKDYMSRHY